jgi:WD40 repeat protein
VAAGAAKPAGTAIMPEGLPQKPAVTTPRAAAVTAIAASPWAPLVAVAGQKQIVLYHSESAQLLGVLPFPEGIPYVLKFSRSGALLLAGGGQNVKRGLVVVYDVRSGKRLFEVGDELDVVLAADISPDHSRVALGGPEKIVRVFSAADGSQIYEIRKHTDWIYAVEFSPDGVLLATADRGGGLVVWEAETGREFHNLEGHKGAVTAVSFRPDSNVLASASEDGTIRLWGMENGQQLKSWGAHGEGGATWLECTHDARIVSCGRDRLVKLWNPDGAPIRALEPMKELVTRAVFTHDAGRVVAGDWSGEVRVWSAADGKSVGTLKTNPGS